MRSKFIVLISLVIILALAIGGFFLFRPKAATAPQSNIDIKDQPTLGNINAPVQIVAFEDLKCGNCKIYNNTLYPKIKKDYIDTGKASYTFINLAFIPGSLPAANAARCLYTQNPKFFFPFVEYIYQNQPPETDDWATVSKLLQFAEESVPSANMDQLSHCMVESRFDSVMDDNLKVAMVLMPMGVATPTLFINGSQVSPLTMDQVKQMIEAAR